MKHAMIPLLILLCAAFARIAPAQQSPAKTASSNQTERKPKREGEITGRVIGPDGQPAPGVRISAHRIGDRAWSRPSAASDVDGNFKLTGLAPGAYAIFAYAPGYVAAELPSENAIHRIGENVTINLVKGGVITGRVTDETGEPIVGVSVLSHRLRDPESKIADLLFDMQSVTNGMSDDRGIYRIYGLPPGVYIVSVGIGDDSGFNGAQIRRDAPTYHPSATRETAAEINLRGGEEVSGVDIRHRGERGRIVSGTFSGDVGPSREPNLLSVTLEGLEIGSFEVETSVSSSLGFVFYGVPDGVYELTATYSSDGVETASSATRRVMVKGMDVSGVKLKLAPLGSIAGRVVIEPSNPPKICAVNSGGGDRAENQTSGQIQEQARRRPVVEEIILRADLDDPNQHAQGTQFDWFDEYGRAPNEKGEFKLNGLEAGRYRIAVNLPDDGWRIRAIRRSGQPATGTARTSAGAAGAAKSPVDASRDGIAIKPGEKLSGVEVIVVEDGAALSGRVVPAKDGIKLPSGLRAHLVPAETSSADDLLRYAETAIRKDGSFEFKHIAPGQYLLYARRVSEKEANDDQVRPAAWDAIERAKLRREAAAAKNEIELKPCQRLKDQVLRWRP